MVNIIETHDISKVYELKKSAKKIQALNKININIKKGEIFGLLGPNGAGKTTLIQILTTLQQPTAGYALIDGYNIIKQPKKAKSKVALMLESDMLYYRITAYYNLKFFCKLYKIPNYKQRIFEVCEDFNLVKWLDQYVENFSSGMKMKLALCRTLLLDREILILDEPTLGLDVKSINLIIEKLKHTKSTIFITSHDMNVVEKLCDRIAFIKDGKILKIGNQEEVKSLVKSDILMNVEIENGALDLKKDLMSHNFVINISKTAKGFQISIESRDNIQELLQILGNYKITGINEEKKTLEDIFMKII